MFGYHYRDKCNSGSLCEPRPLLKETELVETLRFGRCSKTALFGDSSRENVIFFFLVRAQGCKTQELIRQYKKFVIRGQVQSNRCRDPAVAWPVT